MKKRLRLALGLVLAATAALALGAAPEGSFDFDIPSQSVAGALRAFAAQTDMQLLYQTDVVKHARTHALLGRFAREDALQRLLQGTGLEVIFSGENAAIIRRARVDQPQPRPAPASAAAASETGRAREATRQRAVRAPGAIGFFDPILDLEVNLEEVTVTGSRIRRIALDTLQPTMVLDRRTLEERAFSSLAEAFAELPAFGLPGSSPVGGQSSVAVGQSFVNFLGLGSQRTLTLVDGRRFVSANTPAINGATAPGLQVDLNTIPAALVERIEVVAVGGAPVYGADAVAGTVNIIRRKDFQGFAGLAQAGSSEEGGAGRRRFQGTLGRAFHSGRGNIAASFDLSEQDGLRAADRAVMAEALSFQAPGESGAAHRLLLIRDSRVRLVTFDGLPLAAPVSNQAQDFRYAIRDEAGRLLQFTPGGALAPFDPGMPTGSPVFASGGDGINLAETTALLTSSVRRLASVFLDYELDERLSLTAEGWYAGTRSREIVNQPSYNEASFSTPDETARNVLQGPIPLRLDNPFLPAAARTIIARNIDFDGDGAPDPLIDFDLDGVPETPGFWLAKGHQDLFGGSPTRTDQDLYRGVLGLRGVLDVAGRRMSWDVSYNHGRTRSTTSQGLILNREFNRAIDAVYDETSGAIRCRDTSDPRCAPLNMFGHGAPSREAIDYVTTLGRTHSAIEQRVLTANASGSPLSLPGGMVRLAAGAEYRRESSSFEPGLAAMPGIVRTAKLMPVSGGFHTREVYAEAIVPLIGPHQLVPRVHSLELDSAVRLVDHSTAGADLTWTAGLRYAPHPAVRLRGNYTESIRAPAITELFLPTTTVFSLAADPCDSRFIDQGPDPARRAANCAAGGITQPFASRIVNATQAVTIAGDRALENEKADAWSLGVILQPPALPGLGASLDWIDIRLRDAIERFDATAVLKACYDSLGFPEAEVCSRFRRDASGQLLELRTGFLNAGIVDFAGLTGELTYEIDLGSAGALSGALRYFHLAKLDVSVTGSDLDARAGEISNSRNRATLQLLHSKGPVRSSLQLRYVGRALFDRDEAPEDREVRGVGAFWLLNAGVGYALRDGVSVQLNIDNVLNQEPPHPALAGSLGASASGAASTYFPAVLGRTYTLSARIGF